jgi:hypothetical protein
MTRIASILILFGIVLQTLSVMVIYAGYEMNKEYITQKFCENKDKPMMHCNGKCHMAKEIKKAASEDSKKPSSLRTFAEGFVSVRPETAKYISDNIPTVISKINSPYLENYSFIRINTIFHPPLV